MKYLPIHDKFELLPRLPAIIAGVRIATVTTIGLVTVTALIGQGGLGKLVLDGFQRDFHTTLRLGVRTLALHPAPGGFRGLPGDGALPLSVPVQLCSEQHESSLECAAQ